ncbi:MAG: DUF3467 domain-containing protein [Candidatus Methanofastidiosia archaeon]
MSEKVEGEKKKRVKKLKYEIRESPDFKGVFVNGAFGGLSPVDSKVIFYIDRPELKMKRGKSGEMEIKQIKRELQVELHMTPATFKSIAEWMISHVKKYEEQFGKVSKDKEVSGMYG